MASRRATKATKAPERSVVYDDPKQNAAYWAEVDRLNAESERIEQERRSEMEKASERYVEARKGIIADRLAQAQAMVPPMPSAAMATAAPPAGQAIDIAEEARRRIEFEMNWAGAPITSVDNVLQVVHPDDQRVLLTVLPTGKLEYADGMDDGDYQYVIATILQHYMVVGRA